MKICALLNNYCELTMDKIRIGTKDMCMKTRLIIMTICWLSSLTSFAQISRFGSFSQQDWDIKNCTFGKNTSAFVLFDYSDVEIKPKTDIRNNVIECPLKIEFYEITFTRRLRFKVVDATLLRLDPLVFTLKAQGTLMDKLAYFRAIVAWKENVRSKSIKFNAKSLIVEKAADNNSINKFNFNGMRQGCIVDVEYRIISNIFDELPGWNFYHYLPSYYSEYDITIPDFLVYEKINGVIDLVPVDKQMSDEKCDIWFQGTDGNYTFKEYRYFNTSERYILRDLPGSLESGENCFIKYMLKTNSIGNVYGQATRMIANPPKRP